MQEPRHEPSSYFNFSKPPESSSQRSTPVSPGTSVYDRPASKGSPKPSVRKTPTPRSISDYLSYRPSLISQTIEEHDVNKTIGTVQNGRWTHFQDDRSSSNAGKRPALARMSASPARMSPPGTDSIIRQRAIKLPDGLEAAPRPSRRPRPGHVWARTSSGSVWYERLKGSSSHSKQSSDLSTGSAVPQQLLTPLKPPNSPPGSRGPPYQHSVKVEKSFTSLRTGKSPSADHARSRPMAATESRRSSINPLKMFSAPLGLIRKFNLTKRKSKTKVQVSGNSSATIHHGAEMRGHRSLLKRTRTSEALRQATSILHDTAIPSGSRSPVTVIQPLRSRQMSDRSGSSRDSSKQQKHQPRANTGIVSQSYNKMSEQDLLEAGNSFTTSQWDLRMGGQPNNTPDEGATYKVKRSPSAESEEFLKVDISIRGGTSYLPSEARRIHTPPLPQERSNGRRRGFFFDYNAPPVSNAGESSRKHAPRLEVPAHMGGIPQRSTSQAKTVHEQTFTTSLRSARQDMIVAKPKTSDWYDVKLAELDASSDEDEDDATKRPEQARGRSMTNKSGNSLAECKKKKEEEMLDYNIPEHLPNSPLCPRHPRYWRVVQGRGSQFRGCWMHGVGAWEEGEGRIAGVSPV